MVFMAHPALPSTKVKVKVLFGQVGGMEFKSDEKVMVQVFSGVNQTNQLLFLSGNF